LCAVSTAVVAPPAKQLPYQKAHHPVYSRSNPPQLAPCYESNQHLGGKPPCSTGTHSASHHHIKPVERHWVLATFTELCNNVDRLTKRFCFNWNTLPCARHTERSSWADEHSTLQLVACRQCIY
jgi:hypothetical protein